MRICYAPVLSCHPKYHGGASRRVEHVTDSGDGLAGRIILTEHVGPVADLLTWIRRSPDDEQARFIDD
jgi:hypothetical protein